MNAKHQFMNDAENVRNKIDYSVNLINYFEELAEEGRDQQDKLIQHWWPRISKGQLKIVVIELQRLFHLLNITDLDPMDEFMEYIRVVLIEHDVEILDETVKHLTDKFKQK